MRLIKSIEILLIVSLISCSIKVDTSNLQNPVNLGETTIKVPDSGSIGPITGLKIAEVKYNPADSTIVVGLTCQSPVVGNSIENLKCMSVPISGLQVGVWEYQKESVTSQYLELQLKNQKPLDQLGIDAVISLVGDSELPYGGVTAHYKVNVDKFPKDLMLGVRVTNSHLGTGYLYYVIHLVDGTENHTGVAVNPTPVPSPSPTSTPMPSPTPSPSPTPLAGVVPMNQPMWLSESIATLPDINNSRPDLSFNNSGSAMLVHAIQNGYLYNTYSKFLLGQNWLSDTRLDNFPYTSSNSFSGAFPTAGQIFDDGTALAVYYQYGYLSTGTYASYYNGSFWTRQILSTEPASGHAFSANKRNKAIVTFASGNNELSVGMFNGASWNISSWGQGAYPHTAMAEDGTAAVLWSTGSGVKVRIYDPSTGWGSESLLSSKAYSSYSGKIRLVKESPSKNLVAAVAFDDGTGGYVARYNNGSWLTDRHADYRDGYSKHYSMDLSAEGKIVFAYLEYLNSVYSAKAKTFDGSSWSQPVQLTVEGVLGFPEDAAIIGNDAIIGWRMRLNGSNYQQLYTRFNGAQVLGSGLIHETLNNGLENSFTFAKAPNNKLYAVWQKDLKDISWSLLEMHP